MLSLFEIKDDVDECDDERSGQGSNDLPTVEGQYVEEIEDEHQPHGSIYVNMDN